MKVFALLGIREPEMWTDRGCEEVLSLHMSRLGAETAFHEFNPDDAGYDCAEVRELKVLP